MRQRPQKKQDKYRHILVAVAGQTPQIITETLYYLLIKSQPPVPISEIVVITTGKGKEFVKRALLDPLGGQLAAFCREYGIPPGKIKFADDAEHILTLKRLPTVKPQRGKNKAIAAPTAALPELDDIRSSEDNRHLAQQMLSIIKNLTGDPQTALHCSIAGGRKTMSAYLALALTLYGRKQDTLSHVLVPEEFESNNKFFFPPKHNRTIPIRRGMELDLAQTKDAHIELAEIPFIRLREALGEWFSLVDKSVEEIIQTIQYELNLLRNSAQPQLTVDLNKRSISDGAKEVNLPPIRLALYAYFAYARMEAKGFDPAPPGALAVLPRELDLEKFAWFYRQVCSYSEERFSKWLQDAKSKGKLSDNILSYISRINKAIKEAGLSAQLEITPHRKYGDTTYAILIDPEQIKLVEKYSAHALR